MASDQTTLGPYRDWGKLMREAIAGGTRGNGNIAQFIADNTKDGRADDPKRSIHFAAGYIDAVEAWVNEQ